MSKLRISCPELSTPLFWCYQPRLVRIKRGERSGAGPLVNISSRYYRMRKMKITRYECRTWIPEQDTCPGWSRGRITSKKVVIWTSGQFDMSSTPLMKALLWSAKYLHTETFSGALSVYMETQVEHLVDQ